MFRKNESVSDWFSYVQKLINNQYDTVQCMIRGWNVFTQALFCQVGLTGAVIKLMTAVTIHGVMANFPLIKKGILLLRRINALLDTPSTCQPVGISLNSLFGSDVDLFCPECFRLINNCGVHGACAFSPSWWCQIHFHSSESYYLWCTST